MAALMPTEARSDPMTHSLDLATLTVILTDDNGERHDLNAAGEPCKSLADLRDFIYELHGQGAFDADVMRELLRGAF